MKRFLPLLLLSAALSPLKAMADEPVGPTWTQNFGPGGFPSVCQMYRNYSAEGKYIGQSPRCTSARFQQMNEDAKRNTVRTPKTGFDASDSVRFCSLNPTSFYQCMKNQGY